MGANRHTEQPVPKLVPGGRTSRNVSPTDRRTLFGEVPGANYARPRVPVRQGSYGAADVNYAKAYGPEDVRWAPRGRENEREREREFVKPGLVRSATVATY
ncbi:hypothetical protein GQ44DRAFT_778398 [Phaeosphaeriaceae sp. PMI808]|nr:hypothetical protein GQ44DRAFT_778398 [Phaeosphaeriaceae sp. PMI808]